MTSARYHSVHSGEAIVLDASVEQPPYQNSIHIIQVQASKLISHPRMALAGYWNQFLVPLASPPAIQIHAPFRDAHSCEKVFRLIVNHRPDHPLNPPVFISSHRAVLGGNIVSRNTLDPRVITTTNS